MSKWVPARQFSWRSRVSSSRRASRPVSSRSSRRMASREVSPARTEPPVFSHQPGQRSFSAARRVRSTWPFLFTMTTITARWYSPGARGVPRRWVRPRGLRSLSYRSQSSIVYPFPGGGGAASGPSRRRPAGPPPAGGGGLARQAGEGPEACPLPCSIY